VNGVSGFDPMHYSPLQAGLNEHDPALLEALATFGSIDVFINDSVDHDGAWTRYVSGIDGTERIASEGTHTVYRLPAVPPGEAVVGAVLPIVRIDAFRHDPGVIIDGRIETEWGDNPQRPAQWIMVDLGTLQQVGGITHALGEYARDFPRHLIIELSVDGAAWRVAWEGSTAALAFRAAVIAPRETIMRMAFPAQPARFVRLRQGAEHVNMWRVAELQVHAPAGP
jgi:hypothetical protein